MTPCSQPGCSCTYFIPSANPSVCARCVHSHKAPASFIGAPRLGARQASFGPKLPPKQASTSSLYGGPSVPTAYSSGSSVLSASYRPPPPSVPQRQHQPAGSGTARGMASKLANIDVKQFESLLDGLNDTLKSMGKQPLTRKEVTKMMEDDALNKVIAKQQARSSRPRSRSGAKAPSRSSRPLPRPPASSSASSSSSLAATAAAVRAEAMDSPPPRPATSAPSRPVTSAPARPAVAAPPRPSAAPPVRRPQSPQVEGKVGGGRQVPVGGRRKVAGRPMADERVRELQEEVAKLKVDLERERTCRESAEMGGSVRKRLIEQETTTRLAEITGQLDVWREKSARKEAQLKQAKSKVTELQDRVRDLEVQLEAAEAQVAKTEAAGRTQAEELAAAREALQKAKQGSRGQEQQTSALEEELEEAKAALAKAVGEQERQRSIAQQTEARCQQQLQHIHQLLETHVKGLNDRLAQEQQAREAAERQVAALRAGGTAGAAGAIAASAGSAAAVEEAQRAKEDAEEARREIAGRLVQVQMEFAERSDGYERTAHQLRRQKEAAMVELTKAQAQVEALQKQAAGSPLSPRTGGSAEVVTLRQQIGQLEAARATEGKEFERILTELSTVRKEAEAQEEAAREKLASETARLKASHAREMAAVAGGAVGAAVASVGPAAAELEDRNRKLELELSRVAASAAEAEAVKQQAEERLAKEQREQEERVAREKERAASLKAALKESEEARARLEATKTTLEGTIDLLKLNSATADPEWLQGALHEERTRAREEVEAWQQQASEAQAKLLAAEDKLASWKSDAAAGSRLAFEEELQAVKQQLTADLLAAREQNARLQAQVESMRDELGEEGEQRAATPPAAMAPPPPAPGGLPPPPPPPPGPAPSTKLKVTKREGGGAQAAPRTSGPPGVDALRGVTLKKASDRKLLERQDSPPDLLKEIRMGKKLRPVVYEEYEDEEEEEDPTNILQALAKALIARRETLDVDREDEAEEEELWE